MKKLLWGLLVVVLLVVGLLIAAPFLIPTGVYRDQITAAVAKATGRELTINGDFGVSILPRLGLTAEDVRFANAPGASEPHMLTLEALVVELAPWPLLRGELVVDSFRLVEPRLVLAVDERGRGNWQFETPEETAPAEPAAEPGAEETGESPAARLRQLRLGAVRIEDGSILYRAGGDTAPVQVSDVDLQVALPDLDSPFSLQGAATWNEERLSLTVRGEALRPFIEGTGGPLTAGLESEPLTASFDGTVQPQPANLNGRVEVAVPSTRRLAAWFGAELPEREGAFGEAAVSGQLAGDQERIAFQEAEVRFDSLEGSGDLALEIGGAKPRLVADLAVGEVNVNPYLGDPAGETAAEPDAGERDEDGGAAPGWSDAPIDASGLHAANADVILNAQGLRVRDIRIGKSAVALKLVDGRLDLELTETALYEGTGTGNLVLNAGGQALRVESRLALQGIQAEPLLTDAAGFERLTGAGNIALEVSATGNSQKAMVESLSGTGNLRFQDGSIKGVNLAAMVRNIGSAFQAAGTPEAQSTDFAELSGSFDIERGIVRNDDLLLLNPLLRLTGEGAIDLPQRTIDYRVVPKVVASLEGQGGAAAEEGVAVPVLVRGPWHDISYAPDLASVIEDVVRDPKAAEEAIKGTLDRLQESDGDVQPEQLLKGLFGR